MTPPKQSQIRGTGVDRLRSLLRSQAELAVQEGMRNEGQVPVDRLDALERLAKLVQICETAQPPPRRRWPPFVVFGSTLLLASFLFFARVPQTEIELDCSVTETDFVSSKQQVFPNTMQLSSLSAAGVRTIEIPSDSNHDARTLSLSGANDLAFGLSATSKRRKQGTINLAALSLPKGARVAVAYSGRPREYQVVLESTGLDVRASLNGPIRFRFTAIPAADRDFVTPKTFQVQQGSRELYLTLTLPAGTSTLGSQVTVDDLSFTRVNQLIDTSRTTVSQPSTLLNGKLYLESLNGEERNLRPGEILQVRLVQGEIRALSLEEQHIALKFHGIVRGMNIGSGEGLRSIMPTWLDWLKAQHALSLLWGTSLYLFGATMALLRWWGVRI